MNMTTELILQILVFPALGLVWLKLGKIEARLAAGDVRLEYHEQRIAKLERRTETPSL